MPGTDAPSSSPQLDLPWRTQGEAGVEPLQEALGGSQGGGRGRGDRLLNQKMQFIIVQDFLARFFTCSPEEAVEEADELDAAALLLSIRRPPPLSPRPPRF